MSFAMMPLWALDMSCMNSSSGVLAGRGWVRCGHPRMHRGLLLHWFYSMGDPQVVNWLPQNDLLGHKGARAFLTHGGINSLYEVRSPCLEHCFVHILSMFLSLMEAISTSSPPSLLCLPLSPSLPSLSLAQQKEPHPGHRNVGD
jgi:hypothetical protein